MQLQSRHLNTLIIALIGFSVMTQYNNCTRIAVEDITKDGFGSQSGGGGGGGGGPTTTIPTLVDVTTDATFKYDSKKVDIILVIDDSGSMKEDSVNLASKLSGFVQNLEASQLDWQMCLTTTAVNSHDGMSFNWKNVTGATNWIVNNSTPNLDSVFTTTVSSLSFNASGDERGVKALNRHLAHKSSNGCYRDGAALSSIIISDENERSVGGLIAYSNDNQYQPLEPEDQPENYISAVQTSLAQPNTPVALTSHSVVIKSGDTTCNSTQGNGSYGGHYGTVYEALSNLTNGKVGSICATDFTSTLNEFAGQIVKSTHSIQLNCVPYGGIVQLAVTPPPAPGNPLQYHLEGSLLIIDSMITQDISVSVSYKCLY